MVLQGCECTLLVECWWDGSSGGSTGRSCSRLSAKALVVDAAGAAGSGDDAVGFEQVVGEAKEFRWSETRLVPGSRWCLAQSWPSRESPQTGGAEQSCRRAARPSSSDAKILGIRPRHHQHSAQSNLLSTSCLKAREMTNDAVAGVWMESSSSRRPGADGIACCEGSCRLSLEWVSADTEQVVEPLVRASTLPALAPVPWWQCDS